MFHFGINWTGVIRRSLRQTRKSVRWAAKTTPVKKRRRRKY